MNHTFDPTILREYDIRGIVGETHHSQDAYMLGKAFGTYAIRNAGKRVCVGYDGRLTSPELTENLINGLVEVGYRVHNIGLGPTPYVYFATKDRLYDAGIMVTGSHNPSEYNGFKMTLQKTGVFGEISQEIGEIAANQDFNKAQEPRAIEQIDLKEDYIKRLLKDLTTEKDLKIVWDCGNGSAGDVVRKLTAKLPGKHHLLFDDIDGNFPNHHPDPTVEAKCGIERFLRLPVTHDLDGAEQAPATDIADVRMLAEGLMQRIGQFLAFRGNTIDQPVVEQPREHRIRRRARRRMPPVGMAMREEACPVDEGLIDAGAGDGRADRLVASPQPLGHGDDVGHDAFLVGGEQRPAAAHAAHDLIGDEQDAMAVTDLPDAAEVAIDGGDRPHGCTNHRLRDEGRDGLGPGAQDLALDSVAGGVVHQQAAGEQRQVDLLPRVAAQTPDPDDPARVQPRGVGGIAGRRQHDIRAQDEQLPRDLDRETLNAGDALGQEPGVDDDHGVRVASATTARR